jgi:hypothetical protein
MGLPRFVLFLCLLTVGCGNPAPPTATPTTVKGESPSIVGRWEGKSVDPDDAEPLWVSYVFKQDGTYLHWIGKIDDPQAQRLTREIDGVNNYRFAGKKLMLGKNRNLGEVEMSFTLEGDKLTLVFPPEYATPEVELAPPPGQNPVRKPPKAKPLPRHELRRVQDAPQ